MSLEQTLGRGGGEDDARAKELLLLLVESLKGWQTWDVTKTMREREGVVSCHPQITGHVLVITAIPILKIFLDLTLPVTCCVFKSMWSTETNRNQLLVKI